MKRRRSRARAEELEHAFTDRPPRRFALRNPPRTRARGSAGFPAFQVPQDHGRRRRGKRAHRLFDSERPFAEPEIADRSRTAPERDLSAFTFTGSGSRRRSSPRAWSRTERKSQQPEPAKRKHPEESEEAYTATEEPDPEPIENIQPGKPRPAHRIHPGAREKADLAAPWGKPKARGACREAEPEPLPEAERFPRTLRSRRAASMPSRRSSSSASSPPAPQSELSLDSAPRGRFEGETPNVFEGEDLDLPPFLRKKK